MTPEQQRIAIAEACGWRKMEAPKELGFGASAPDKCWYFTHQLPNYLNDLNAMHEAEMKLNNSKDAGTYMRHLIRIVRNLIVKEDSSVLNGWTTYALVHATAAQRAEAFLRTLNLWQNS